MTARIAFQVMIAGQNPQVEEIEYEPGEVSGEPRPSERFRQELEEAIEKLRESIGHDDFEVVYWWWLK